MDGSNSSPFQGEVAPKGSEGGRKAADGSMISP
jgi:hypothetical protein